MIRYGILCLIAVAAIAASGARPTLPQSRVGMTGTLITTVPAKDGLIVASDTRSTTMGARCDGNSKLAVVRGIPLTMVGASGTATWIEARVPLWLDDPCGDLAKNGVVFLDAKQIAVSYLEEQKKAAVGN